MNQEKISKRIEAIKNELSNLGDLRPGSLSVQKRAAKGAYHHLSYSHRGKGHTEYVSLARKEQVEEQIANHKRLRELTQEWIDLALQLCLMKAGKKTSE